jgi:hypothetical protein
MRIAANITELIGRTPRPSNRVAAGVEAESSKARTR